MFTVEYHEDNIEVVSLDDTGDNEDVWMNIEEDGTIFLSQWDDMLDDYQVLIISSKQWDDLREAMNKPEGAYRIHERRL